jgi:hypothetical protein
MHTREKYQIKRLNLKMMKFKWRIKKEKPRIILHITNKKTQFNGKPNPSQAVFALDLLILFNYKTLWSYKILHDHINTLP